MKKIFTSMCALAMLGAAVPTFAQESGDYYLYDQANKVFLSRGASWGTEATVDKYGVPFTWNSETGIINFKDWGGVGLHIESNGTSIYTDNGNPTKFAFTATNGGYYLQDGDLKTYARHDNGDFGEYVNMTDDASKAVVWTLLTKAERDAIVNAYPAENKTAVATAAGITGNFDTTIAGYQSIIVKNIAPNDYTWKNVSRGNANSSDPREVYQGTGNFTTTLSGLGKGLYKATIQAFERDGSNASCASLDGEGYDITTSYFQAGDQQVRVKGWAEERIADNNPNSVAEAKAAFESGKYNNEVYFYVANDNTDVNLKVAVPSHNNAHWFIMGNTVVSKLTQGISEEEANKIITTAQGLESQKMNADVLSALTNAEKAFSADKTSGDKYQTLSQAVQDANVSVAAYANAKAALDNRAALLETTNFYKADDSFLTTPSAAYEAGTLTNAEANALEDPYASSKIGWHASTQLNQFFGVAWGFSDYNTGLYINTWSVEGDNDGSNFKVPFYEYWTGDAAVLADRTLTGTVSGLKANTTYNVTAAVRVRISNGQKAPATGISMQVGEGAPIEITGTQVGASDSPMYLDNYTATGNTDADGNLTVKFNIAGTNVSWLSFQHVKYAEGTATAIKNIDVNKASNDAIYNLAGQRVGKDYKGVVIINGKKAIRK